MLFNQFAREVLSNLIFLNSFLFNSFLSRWDSYTKKKKQNKNLDKLSVEFEPETKIKLFCVMLILPSNAFKANNLNNHILKNIKFPF